MSETAELIYGEHLLRLLADESNDEGAAAMFARGAAWWEFRRTGATMWASDRSQSIEAGRKDAAHVRGHVQHLKENHK